MKKMILTLSRFVRPSIILSVAFSIALLSSSARAYEDHVIKVTGSAEGGFLRDKEGGAKDAALGLLSYTCKDKYNGVLVGEPICETITSAWGPFRGNNIQGCKATCRVETESDRKAQAAKALADRNEWAQLEINYPKLQAQLASCRGILDDLEQKENANKPFKEVRNISLSILNLTRSNCSNMIYSKYSYEYCQNLADECSKKLTAVLARTKANEGENIKSATVLTEKKVAKKKSVSKNQEAASGSSSAIAR